MDAKRLATSQTDQRNPLPHLVIWNDPDLMEFLDRIEHDPCVCRDHVAIRQDVPGPFRRQPIKPVDAFFRDEDDGPNAGREHAVCVGNAHFIFLAFSNMNTDARAPTSPPRDV